LKKWRIVPDGQPAPGFLGSLAADAVAMPVHWYYDREALKRDYGTIAGYVAHRAYDLAFC